MPNKDSFTFSDKLRKSKSVPLSKRLPSIVGGKNTQKRTLVQRAQRDLPFILVAALALLLLPFLSRTGSDDIATTGDLAWNTLSDERSFAEGGGADIMPAGSMQDPLDLILRPRSEVETSAVTVGSEAKKSAYGSGSGSGDRYSDGSSGYRSSRYSSSGSSSSSSPDYSTRKSYDEKYTTRTTKKPATAQYAKTTRPAIRKSFERKGTDINRALRISQMPGNKGATGISHSLPIGQGPTRGSSDYNNPGVRPIALQPMESRGGVGRSMTGENLYAEASRSIGEMNRGGPAKANLLAAQMRDVDGKLSPEGPGFGGPGAGGPGVKPGGAGGGPNNNNGYSVGKPWWWDMMQSRSQKMWELLYYKPREIFWNNIYNYMSQLMNCLATGNKDGDVSTMFGKKAGTGETTCEGNPKWTVSLEDFIENNAGKSTQKTSDGKGETSTTDTDGARKFWEERCLSVAGAEITYSQSSRKSLLQTRFECVGLNWGWVKGLFAAKAYKANCATVNKDPMKFTYSITKNGKEKKRLENKAVIALVARVNKDAYGEKRHDVESTTNKYYSVKGQEVVIYAQVGNEFSMSEAEVKELYDPKYCKLTKLIAFVPREFRWSVKNAVEDANFSRDFNKAIYEEDNPPEVIIDSSGTVSRTKRYTRKENRAERRHTEGKVNNMVRFRGQVDAARDICSGTTVTDVHPLTLDGVYDIADFVSDAGIKNGSFKTCTIYDIADRPFIKKKWINGKPCDKFPHFPIEMKGIQTASARITRPSDKVNVFAVVIEENDGESKAKVIYTAKMNDQAVEVDGKTATYVLETSAFGTKGFNPNQKDGSVKIDYSVNNSSRDTTNNADARAKGYATTTQANTNRDKQCSDCQAQLAQMKDAEKEKYLAQVELCKSLCGQSDGNYQGDSDSSSSKDPGTAPGSGRVYWILTESDKLLVKTGDEFETLHDIEEDQLAEGIIDISYCYYRWCHGIADCTLNDIPPDYCQEDGQVFLAYEVSVGKESYYIKDETHGAQETFITDVMPKCTKLCYDDEGKLHKCDQNGEPEEIIGTVPESYKSIIKRCPSCCTYTKGFNYLSTKLKGQDGKDHQYIIDAEPNKCNNPEGPCTVAAWSHEGNDLIVYDMSTYDPKCLKLVPGESGEPFRTCTGTGEDCNQTVTLTKIDAKPFDTIHNQSYTMKPNKVPGNPQFFELFPQLKAVAPEDIPEIDLTVCNYCGRSEYCNADIKAHPKIIEELATNVDECLIQIEQLKQLNIKFDFSVFDNLYFYGYASKRGSHKPGLISGAPTVGCVTNDAKNGNTDSDDELWGYCNKALSEDRNLYIMDQLIGRLPKTYKISVPEKYKYPDYNGFGNTSPRDLVDSGTHRFDKIEYMLTNSVDNPDLVFISRPCGSDGAEHAFNASLQEQLNDRYVLVTPMDKENYCGDNNRMTCELADKKMTDVVKSLNAAIKEKYKITVDKVIYNKGKVYKHNIPCSGKSTSKKRIPPMSPDMRAYLERSAPAEMVIDNTNYVPQHYQTELLGELLDENPGGFHTTMTFDEFLDGEGDKNSGTSNEPNIFRRSATMIKGVQNGTKRAIAGVSGLLRNDKKDGDPA